MAVATSRRRATVGQISRLLREGYLGTNYAEAETLEVSIIIPLLNEEDSLPHLHRQLKKALQELGRSYEVIYVDDGSRDGSFQCLCGLAAADSTVRVIRFRRNFGQTAAIQAGIEYSRGKVLVFMDADLQNDPGDIRRLIAKLDEGYDVVSGWRKDRHDATLRRKLPSRIANGLISRVTGIALHDHGCTLKVYRREVMEDVKLYGEMHRFIPAFAALAGASVAELPVTHHARRFGKSKYGLSRTIRVLLDLMTVKFLGSYSTKPSYVFGSIGFLLWTLSCAVGCLVILERLLPPYPQAHNNPLLLLAVFLAIVGVQFIMLGLLAELIVRTYHESQGKPIYVVRQVVESSAPTPGKGQAVNRE
jgi:glycosyltransferase involved in cell wall biosynthesis